MSTRSGLRNQPLSILAGAVEALENRVRTVEGGQPSEDEESASTEDDPDDEGTDRGDHRIRRRHRGPLRRRRSVPAGLPRTSTTPSSAEPDEQFAAWVEELRGQGLTERIPADWREIPLVVSELQALRSAWLSCRRSSRHSFEWVYWDDALGRALGRIEDWWMQHQKRQGLSTRVDGDLDR